MLTFKKPPPLLQGQRLRPPCWVDAYNAQAVPSLHSADALLSRQDEGQLFATSLEERCDESEEAWQAVSGQRRRGVRDDAYQRRVHLGLRQKGAARHSKD